MEYVVFIVGLLVLVVLTIVSANFIRAMKLTNTIFDQMDRTKIIAENSKAEWYWGWWKTALRETFTSWDPSQVIIIHSTQIDWKGNIINEPETTNYPEGEYLR